ncbi:MAG: cytoplasmic protein [Desulfobulbus sp.]
MFFGLDRETDEQSLIEFLHHFNDERLLRVLVPRMSEEEIHQVVDLLGLIMKNNLSGDEYHRLFLHEEHHHH